MMRAIVRIVIPVLVVWFGMLSIHGQITTATISGTIKDSTGGVLPGVEVQVKNVGTGIARTVVTDDEGRYRAPNLELGDYQVQASLPGFRTEVRSGIRLTVGREAVVDFVLRVGEITERVVVTGEARLVETTSGTLSGLVESKQVLDLPLNGRDLSQLITLQTGTVQNYNAGGEQGAGKSISVSGGRPTANVFLIDGTNVNAFHDRTPTGSSGSFLGVEAVREFKVEANSYSAEFGRGGGGVFNIVTKSGTNRLHGSVFQFHRNDNLDARNFFDAAGKPEFKRNQYGFSVGGPVLKERTFFFGTYEGLRERLGLTRIDRTFTAAVRNGSIPDPRTGRITIVPVDPRVRPYLALWPLPSAPILDHGDGTGDWTRAFSRPTDEDFFQVRVDHKPTDNDSFFTRYSFLDSERVTPGSFLQSRTIETTRNQYVTMEEKRIFSPNLLNTFRFGFSRTTPSELSEHDPVDPTLHFVPGSPLPGSISVSGVSGVGEAITRDRRFINRFQYIDDVAHARGTHSLKLGINWEYIQFNGNNPARDAGNYSFGSIADFFTANPSRFRGAIAPGSNDPDRSVRQNLVGLYVQDDMKLRPGFALNLGLRYEFITVPTEKHGRIANFRTNPVTATLDDIVIGDPWVLNPSLRNFAPRVGFAWDVTGSGKTALRGGFGVFHYQLTQTWFRTTIFRMPPFLIEIQATQNVPFPDIFQVCLRRDPRCTGRPAPDTVAFKLKNPYMMQYNLNLQRELAPETVMTLGYAGSRGVALPAVSDINVVFGQLVNGRLFFPQTGRPNPNFDDIRLRHPAASSSYHSLQVGVNRRFSKGVHLQGSYTISKAMDEASGNQTGSVDFEGTTSWVVYHHNIKLHRALAAFDVRHAFALNHVYELPFGPGKPFGSSWTGPAAKLLGGWQLGGILTIASGPPGTVEVSARHTNLGLRIDLPDLRPGASNSPRLGGPDRYFDPDAFLFPPDRIFGNLGRNTLFLPGVATYDFSLTKNTYLPSISEDFSIQFRAEFFNIFNRANFGIPSLTVFDRRGRPQARAGRITETSTTSRQIQFGLKIVF